MSANDKCSHKEIVELYGRLQDANDMVGLIGSDLEVLFDRQGCEIRQIPDT